jgi:hypothetical protein
MDARAYLQQHVKSREVIDAFLKRDYDDAYDAVTAGP